MRLNRLTASVLAGLTLAVTQGAMAQAPATGDSDWQFRGGVALLLSPKVLGGKEMRALPVPFIEAKHRSGFFASPQDGVGMSWTPAPAWQVSASLGLDMRQRRGKDDARLATWEDIKLAPALLLGAQYRDGPWSASARLQTRLKREGEGRQYGASTLQLDLGYGFYNSAQLRMQTGYALTLMNDRFAKTFFSVSPGQSKSSGLAAHNAKAGAMSSAAFLQAQIATDSPWQVYVRGEWEVLQGDAASSPVVQRKSQPSLLLAVTRPF